LNLNQVLVDLDQQPFADGATYKTVILSSLLATLPGDEKAGAKEKVSLFQLSMKVHDQADDCDLTSEEITLIKDRVGRAFAPLVVGRVFALIDPATIGR